MSGFLGDNLAEPSKNMPWYKGFEVKVKKEKVKGVGDVVTGRVEQGKITPGVKVRFYPTGCTGDVLAIDDIKEDPEPPRAAKEFTALVFVQDHPGKLSCGKQEKDKKTGTMVDKG